jgi:hypothetical protein
VREWDERESDESDHHDPSDSTAKRRNRRERVGGRSASNPVERAAQARPDHDEREC